MSWITQKEERICSKEELTNRFGGASNKGDQDLRQACIDNHLEEIHTAVEKIRIVLERFRR